MSESDDQKILFYSEGIDFTIPTENSIRQWLKSIAKTENKELNYINYVFLSDEGLLSKNKEFLNHDYYTDIISFQMEQNPIAGDIFISIDRVKENAKTYGIEFITELLRVLSHGLLHFIGYGDKSEKEVKVMRSKEDYYLNQYNYESGS